MAGTIDIAQEFRYLLGLGRVSLPRKYDIIPFVPTPTPNDYEVGWIVRYFSQKTNDIGAIITEIDKNTFDVLEDISYYRTISLRWMISGPLNTLYNSNGTEKVRGTVTVNQKILDMKERDMPGLQLRLPNLKQFHKEY